MNIGRLGSLTETNVETIRYYERIGLLPPPPRTQSNYRDYDDGHVRRLSFIRRARALGFHLDTIRALLDVSDRPDQSCAGVDALTRRQIAEVEAKIADLTRLRDELVRLAGQCRGDRIRDCRIIEALSPPVLPEPLPEMPAQGRP
ncbi:MerR family transcriptional regulator [Rhodospirillum centenum]|uniref:HTH-type transcriptional regulator cueR n=1 Tax=Rhodospirillum centenum (strain ATCC 51521 / SW) TaxID=414684 RepID=B6IQ54_RHOCS|nr:helix-turn-helix domain-containing protein [Rhodospirillum centenum]ACI97590.1 HTH-type transcriptional regulator cueR [Rhodospirillum centenum SW]